MPARPLNVGPLGRQELTGWDSSNVYRLALSPAYRYFVFGVMVAMSLVGLGLIVAALGMGMANITTIRAGSPRPGPRHRDIIGQTRDTGRPSSPDATERSTR